MNLSNVPFGVPTLVGISPAAQLLPTKVGTPNGFRLQAVLRTLAGLSLTLVAVASAQTPVFDFTIPRISSPRIDGDLSDLAWTEASQLGGKIVMDLDNTGYSRVRRPRIGYVGYDSTALYVAVIDYSPSPEKLAANDKAFWQGDSVEIYAQWDRSNPNAYIQFGITPSGYIELRPADEKPRSKNDLLLRVKKTDLCWNTEVAIPFALFGVTPPRPGDVWGMNVCGRQSAFPTSSTGILSWSAVYGAFAQPHRFAKARFGE